jgi:hypothetical protein
LSPFPTPHLDKLTATFENTKLPECDKARLQHAVKQYDWWIKSLDAVAGEPDERITKMVALLNEYRIYVDLELIFDSDEDFLYRQKGQLKLDNSVIEEFLPRIIHPSIVPEMAACDVLVGPANAFLSVFFTSSLTVPEIGGGLNVRTKDQDFTIAKRLFVQTSYSPKFEAGKIETHETSLAYIAAECKTNLDKTMFQEACATARDTKLAVTGAKYFLLCEWLDMTPVSTATTDIDEVIILRMAKRLNSNIRQRYSSSVNRKKAREEYKAFLTSSPFRKEMFVRFIEHVKALLKDKPPEEREVLKQGYF